MRLSEEEKTELRALAKSATMLNDSELLRATRHNPFMVNGVIDCDKVIEFLTEYNEFMGHRRKSRRQFLEKDMKL
jgi:hypothetical protein